MATMNEAMPPLTKASSPLKLIEATFWPNSMSDLLKACFLGEGAEEHHHGALVDFAITGIDELSDRLRGLPGGIEDDDDVGRVVRKVVLPHALLCKNGRSGTPLHVAATLKDLPRVQWLLRMGAKVRGREKKGDMALQMPYALGCGSGYDIVV